MKVAKHSEGRMRACPPSIGRFKLGVASPRSGALKIVGEVSNYSEEALEDQRRIVACWNACEGISTESLESESSAVMGWTRTASKLINATKQRDELLATLEQLIASADEPIPSLTDDQLHEILVDPEATEAVRKQAAAMLKARSTIAAMKGGAA